MITASYSRPRGCATQIEFVSAHYGQLEESIDIMRIRQLCFPRPPGRFALISNHRKFIDVLEKAWKGDPSKFVAPVAFVDGHVARHDFSPSIKPNAPYIYEESKDWIWYKPKRQDQTSKLPLDKSQ